MTDLVYLLRHPTQGTETSERNIMKMAADEIEILRLEAIGYAMALEKIIYSESDEKDVLVAIAKASLGSSTWFQPSVEELG